MSPVFRVDPERPDQAGPAIDHAVRALVSGRLVVFPTETVYGIAARPDLSEATDRLFAAKRRPPGLALPVLAPSTEAAWEVASATKAAERLAEWFWPGPLTLVLERADASRGWRLGEEAGSVGVRVPAHPLTAALLSRAGPLATTSANLSGRPPVAEPEELTATFGDSVAVYLLLAPGGPEPEGRPSTVVDVRGPEPKILRRGAIEQAEVLRVLEVPGGRRTR